MIIHCTKKLAARLPDVAVQALEETSPLGSWHAKLLHFDRRQCLFMSHDQSRSVLFIPGVRKANLLDLDPVAVSARLSRRPATIRKQWVRPCELLLQQAEDLN